MAEYARTEVVRFPHTADVLGAGPEARFWSKFKTPRSYRPDEHRQYGKVTDLEFSPIVPHELAVTASTRVTILDKNTLDVKRQITRFRNVAYSGSFRRDGKLIVAADESGDVQIFDVNSRAVLRHLKGHTAATHVARFGRHEMSKIYSCSDDSSVRRWDMLTETELCAWTEHADYVRAFTEHPISDSTFFSGSYDHTIKVWDHRQPKSVSTLNHGHPIEALHCTSTGSLVFSAGHNIIKVWDLIAGGKCISTLSQHQKPITCLAIDGSQTRLFSGGLDHFVKIYDLSTYSVTHSIKYEEPVLSCAISPDNTLLAVGCVSGQVVVRQRDLSLMQTKRKRERRTGTARFFNRGIDYAPKEDDLMLPLSRKQHLEEFDKYLRRFQYRDALDTALQSGKPAIVYTVLDELIDRGALKIALSGRDEVTLVPVMKFLLRHINSPRFSNVIIDTTNMVLDIYTSAIGQSVAIDSLFLQLQRKITDETSTQKQLHQLLGGIETIISSASGTAASAVEMITENSDTDKANENRSLATESITNVEEDKR